MSRNNIFIYTKDIITTNDFINIMKAVGGYDQSSKRRTYWGLTRKEATIWVYYENEPANFIEFKDDIIKKYGFSPSNEIWIDLDNSDGSSKLALDFCIELATMYNNTVIVDELGNFYKAEELSKIETQKNSYWGFKNSQ